MLKKILFFILLLSFLAIKPLQAAPTLVKKDGAIYVKSATTAEVEDLFKKYNYDDFSKSKTKFPRIFLQKLPTDWAQVPDSHDKHRTFIRIMLPLVLKINEGILAERAVLEKIYQHWKNEHKLSDEEKKQFEEFVLKYDVFTPKKGDSRIEHLLILLLPKIDAVPPSIMVTTAGIYSDWGTTRLALEGNNLYRTEVWYTDKGIKPVDDPDAQYRYQTYASLEEAISERALKINSHVNYDYVRITRMQARKLKSPPYSPQLVAQMLNDSNLHNVAGLIDYTFSYYKLSRTDFLPQLRSVE